MSDLITDLVAHLKATLTTAPADLRNSVAGIAELEEAQGATVLNTPYAYVFLLGEQAREDTLITGISQKVIVTFAIVTVVANVCGPVVLKGPTVSALPGVRVPIIDTVLGWQHTADHDPTTYRQGRLIQVKNKSLWWQDEFQTAYYLRKID